MATGEAHTVQVTVRLEDQRVLEILKRGFSSALFTEFVMARIPLMEWLEAYAAPRAPQEDAVLGGPSGLSHWTESTLHEFLDELASRRSGYELISLLLAHGELGAETEGDDLRRVSGFEEYPLGESLWPQVLKGAKRRLRTLCEKEGRMPLFLETKRQKGTRLSRMNAQIHEWLNTWIDNMPSEKRRPPNRWASFHDLWLRLLSNGLEVEEGAGPPEVHDWNGRPMRLEHLQNSVRGVA